VLEVRGIKEMQEKTIAAIPATQRSLLGPILKTQLSEANLKEMIQKSSNNAYPNHPVGIGESWTQNISLSAGFPIKLDMTYTLRDRQNGIANLDVSGKIAMDSDGKSMGMPGAGISMKINGQQTGTMQVRESDGWVLKSQHALRFSGTMTVDKPKKSWPIYSSMTTTVESSEL